MSLHLLSLSPFLVMFACHLAARASDKWLRWDWKWVPNLMLYWGLLSILIVLNWSQVEPLLHLTNRFIWLAILALAVGFIPLPILIFNKHLLRNKGVFAAWMLFAFINPLFEELYWRGVLVNHFAEWSVIGSMLITSLLFSVHHKIAWEPITPVMGHPHLLISTAVMGLIWSASVIYCHTILWAIISHIAVDLFNLAVPVYLNRYHPPNWVRKNDHEPPTYT